MNTLVKYPLDRVCVKSGIFCPSCQRKLDSGEVDREEVEIIRQLMELESEYSELRRGEYVKSYNLSDTTIVLFKDEWEVSEKNKLARALSSKLGRRVKVVTPTGDQREVVEQILSPMHVVGINTVWLPDGTEQISIIVSRRDYKKLDNVGEWERVLTKILEKPTRIRFE